ncbi:hypothetical protein [Moraxella sp. VT-16-12]|uniref:hypothetical protein n=1 Tax=Moraxella sp. VT-16-12 TaxID=2014877 RepID=UPI000B7FEA0B|nr:hypothetical protein [Moraxella sp. VT-16-12]TWV80427.1 hypothetical protein CEW93_010085 [Moraxella sp. VT-16-12]
MKIRYLKPALNAAAGDIKDIATSHAKVLILLGYAEVYGEEQENVSKTGELFPQDDTKDDMSDHPESVTDAKPQTQTTPTKKTKTKKAHTETQQ